MRRSPFILALIFAASCGDSSSGPSINGEATATIKRFNLAADSLEASGNYDVASAMRVIADLVKMTGGVTTLTVANGSVSSAPGTFAVTTPAGSYQAIALKLSSPASISCDPFFGCDTLPAVDEHLLISWRASTLDQAIAILADSAGTMSVAIDTGTTDSGDDFGLGAVGLVIDRDQHGYISTAGTETQNMVSASGGACAKTTSIPDDVQYTCVRGVMRVAYNMQVADAEHLFDPVPPAPISLSLASTDVAAAHISVSQAVASVMMRKLRPARLEGVALRRARGAVVPASHR